MTWFDRFRWWPALLGLTLAAVPVAAQTVPPLTWELVGETSFEARGLLATGIEAEGTGDLPAAVYAVGLDGLFVIRPGDEDWTLVADFPTLRADRDLFVTRAGTLLANSNRRIQRSTDGGQTWVDVNDGGNAPPVYTPDGALITGYRTGVEVTVTRSTDDGQTWEQIDMEPTLGGRTLPVSIAVLPPSDDLPNGRIVAGGNGGLVYSDDDGFSWHPTNVFTDFAFRASAVVLAPWGGVPGDPDRGTLYAQVNDFAGGENGEVWESTDGATWAEVGRIPGIADDGAYVIAVGDGSPDGSPDGSGGTLYAVDPGEPEDIQVYASADRGRTWSGTGPIPAEEVLGNPVRIQELVLGPEGRLWQGVTGQGPTTGGVFRTVEPVFPVNAEGSPGDGPEGGPGKPGAELGAAYPNPTAGQATVTLTLPKAAEVRAAVYDVLGREVAVLHDGPLAVGSHWLAFDADLPTGVYLVRAIGDGLRAAQRVTVVR